MAGEEIFVASALLTLGMLGFFAFMYYYTERAKANIYQQGLSESLSRIPIMTKDIMLAAWQVGMVLTLAHSWNVMQIGFNVTGLFTLRDEANTFLVVILYCLYGLLGITVINLLLRVLGYVMEIARKMREDYG